MEHFAIATTASRDISLLAIVSAAKAVLSKAVFWLSAPQLAVVPLLCIADPSVVVVAYQFLLPAFTGLLLSYALAKPNVLGTLACAVLCPLLLVPFQLVGIAVAGGILCVATVTAYQRLSRCFTGAAPYPPAVWYQNAHNKIISQPQLLKAVLFKILALLACLVSVFAFSQSWITGQLLIGVLVVLIWQVPRLIRRARKLEVLLSDDLQQLDRRRPILLLRAFADDQLPTQPSRQAQPDDLSVPRFEERLAEVISPHGPIVAVGIPGEDTTPLGAARKYLATSDWQAAVARMISDARIIVVIAARSGGLDWEIRELVARGCLDKAIFIVPPVQAGSKASSGALGADERVRHVLQLLNAESPGQSQDLSRVVAFAVHDHTLMFFLAKLRVGAAYSEALRIGLALDGSDGDGVAPVDRNEFRTSTVLLRRVYDPLAGRPSGPSMSLSVLIIVLTGLIAFFTEVAVAGIYSSITLIEQLIGIFKMTIVFQSLAIVCIVALCWLVKLQGRFANGPETMQRVFSCFALSLTPLLTVLVMGVVLDIATGEDYFVGLRNPGLLGGLEAFTVAQKFSSVVVYAVLGLVLVRFVFGLSRIWAVPVLQALTSVMVATLVISGLFLVAKNSVAEESRRLDTKAVTAKLKNHQALSSAAEKAKEDEQWQTKFCRCFKENESDQLVLWASQFRDLHPNVTVNVDDDDKILDICHCVETTVGIFALLGKELRFFIGNLRGASRQ